MAKPVFNIDALYVVLDRKRRAQRISWRKLLDQAGIANNNGVITRLARGQQMSTVTLAPLLVWLGDTDVGPYITAPAPAGDTEREA